MPNYMAVNYCESFFGKANYDYAKARQFFKDLTTIAPLQDIRKILSEFETKLDGKIITFDKRFLIRNAIITAFQPEPKIIEPRIKLNQRYSEIEARLREEWSGSLDNIGIPQKFSGVNDHSGHTSS